MFLDQVCVLTALMVSKSYRFRDLSSVSIR
jgi:hypothetical protein